MNAPREPVHALLLAAGGSRRLGQPKQLVRVDGVSLVRRATLAVLAAPVASLTVVVGAAREAVVAELRGIPLSIAVAHDWEEGMGASLRCGLAALPGDVAVLVLLCDQLAVDAAHTAALVRAFHASSRPIVASQYLGTLGVPAIFGAVLRPELGQLRGDQGARDIVRLDRTRVVAVPLANGELDVDRPCDLSSLSPPGDRP